MLTQEEQRVVWEGWLGAEIRANYFADLSTGYRRRQRIATWCSLFLSSGAFVTWISGWVSQNVPWVPPALALLTAGLSGYALVAANQQSAVDSADLHLRWNKLASAYRHLWDHMYDQDAEAQLAALEEQERDLSKSGTSFPYRARRMEKWEDHVLRQHHLAA